MRKVHLGIILVTSAVFIIGLIENAQSDVAFIAGDKEISFKSKKMPTSFTCPDNSGWYMGQCKAKCDEKIYLLSGDPDNTIGDAETCESVFGNRYTYTSCHDGWTLVDGNCIEDACEGFESTEEASNIVGPYQRCKSGRVMKYKYMSCNEGWDFLNGKCNIHTCRSSAYPYKSKPSDIAGTIISCKTGVTTLYGYTGCTADYDFKEGQCIGKCSLTETSLPNNCAIPSDSCEKNGATYYTSSCAVCNSGYKLNNGTCIGNLCTNFGAIEETLSNCTNKEEETCISGTTTRYKCTACKEGYDLIYGACLQGGCTSVANCSVGDVFYAPDPIGVVFANDGAKVKIIGLKNIDKNGEEYTKFDPDEEKYKGTLYEKSIWWGNPYYIESLPRYTSRDKESMEALKQDMNGKTNTDIIIKEAQHGAATVTAAPATKTYNPSNCHFDFCKRGTWYLPSAGEFVLIAKNALAINEAMKTVGGDLFSNTKGGSTYHLSNIGLRADTPYGNANFKWWAYLYIRNAGEKEGLKVDFWLTCGNGSAHLRPALEVTQ